MSPVADREAKLRGGYVEEVWFGGQLILCLAWLPRFINGEPSQDFCIDWPGPGTRTWIHDYDEAVREFEQVEREFVIKEMARALLGPQDTVKIIRPPKF